MLARLKTMREKAASKSPWQPRKTVRRNISRMALVVALLIGAGIGLMWPTPRLPSSVPAKPPEVIYNPDPPRKKRAESPTPLPPADAYDRRIPAAPVVRASFGYCAGRTGTNCVVDGDTFILEGQSIRLAPIDAPEIGGARCPEERRRGEAAEKRLHALLNSGSVQLTISGDRDRDRFGRLLRDAEVNGVSVSAQLIAEGHARPWGGGKQPWC